MTIYYIDPALGSDANSGLTELLPILNYTKASFMSGLVAGDIVKQKSGTTWVGEVGIVTNGTAANPITFTSYGTGEKPIVDGNAGSYAILINGNNSYNIIDGMAARNVNGSTSAVIYKATGTGTNNTVIRCHVSGARHATSAGIKMFRENNKILHCTIRDMGGDGIYFEGDYVEVGWNDIAEVSRDGASGDNIQTTGITYSSSHFWVHDNILDHTESDSKQCFISSSTGTGTGGRFEWNSCLGHSVSATLKCVYNEQPNVVFRYNYLTNGTRAFDIQGSGCTIHSNLVVQSNDGTGILMNVAPNTSIFNNTFVNLSVSTAVGISHFNASTDGDGSLFTNNIVVGYKYGIRRNTTTTTTEQYNCCYDCEFPFVNSGLGTIAAGTGSITTDPQLRSDYSIPSTSPCKGTGTFVGNFGDYYGKRYNLAAIDMGAVAFSTAPSITTRSVTTRTVTTRTIATRRKVAG